MPACRLEHTSVFALEEPTLQAVRGKLEKHPEPEERKKKRGKKKGKSRAKKSVVFREFSNRIKDFFFRKKWSSLSLAKVEPWDKNLSHGSTCACGVKKKDFLHRRNFNEKTILFSIKVGNLHQLNHCGHFKPNYVVVGPRTMDTSKTP